MLSKQANRWVFSSRWNWSGPRVESQRLSGSEFQTVGPADAKARRPITRRTRGTFSCWRPADRIGAGDQRLQRRKCSDRQGTSVLDSGDIGERSSKLLLHPLRNVEPVQFIVEQPWQTSIVLAGARDQTCCGVQYPLQLISDRLQRWGQVSLRVVGKRMEVHPMVCYKVSHV